MKKAVLCTHNPHKINEISEILPVFQWITLQDIGFFEEIPEEGNTFEENARQKVAFVATHTHLPPTLLVSDDSGLEIDALGGRPGVHSALYMGKDQNYPKKCDGILAELQDVPSEKRTARFVCVVAARIPSGDIFTFRSTCEGRIAFEKRGTGGFGFDPIFLPSYYHYEKTMAELSSKEKHFISHRGKAFRTFLEWIKREGALYGIV